MRLLFAGDGERDAATVPHVVARILDTPVEPVARHWARLNGAGKGYQRKVRFAVLQAMDVGAVGLVAVVDRDKEAARSRLAELRGAREADRMERPPYPTAFGEANPHGEAWLLDDPAAVRGALGLPDEVSVTSVQRTRDPKAVINNLIQSSGRAEHIMTILGDIAIRVVPSRCVHSKQTGLGDFVAEVQSELGPLVNS